MLGSGSVSAGAGFTQNLCGDFLLGVRTLLADIHLDRVFAGLSMRVDAVVVAAVCPSRSCIGAGIRAVVDHLVTAAGSKTGSHDGGKKDQSKEQCEDFFHCFLLLLRYAVFSDRLSTTHTVYNIIRTNCRKFAKIVRNLSIFVIWKDAALGLGQNAERKRPSDVVRDSSTHFVPGADTRNLNRRGSTLWRPLVSVDLRTDEIPSTGGHRFFAPFSTEEEPLALPPGVPNPGMTFWAYACGR